MKIHAFLTSLCALVACASISGTQTFQATQQYAMPDIAAVGGTGSRTITAVGAADQKSFAASVLDDIDRLRDSDHIDSADATIRVVSVRLSTDTTFAGITAIRAQLVTDGETLELCSRTLSADEQNASSVSCDADSVIAESTLQQNMTTVAPAQIGAQLEVSGAVSATKLKSVVTFEVEVNVDASL